MGPAKLQARRSISIWSCHRRLSARTEHPTCRQGQGVPCLLFERGSGVCEEAAGRVCPAVVVESENELADPRQRSVYFVLSVVPEGSERRHPASAPIHHPPLASSFQRARTSGCWPGGGSRNTPRNACTCAVACVSVLHKALLPHHRRVSALINAFFYIELIPTPNSSKLST
jgi:hypothetical protein